MIYNIIIKNKKTNLKEGTEMFDNKLEYGLQLTTEQVYELGKQLKERLVRLQENNDIYESCKEYRKFLRKMRGFGLITRGQRDYLVGIILKQNSDCIGFFNVLGLRKYK